MPAMSVSSLSFSRSVAVEPVAIALELGDAVGEVRNGAGGGGTEDESGENVVFVIHDSCFRVHWNIVRRRCRC